MRQQEKIKYDTYLAHKLQTHYAIQKERRLQKTESSRVGRVVILGMGMVMGRGPRMRRRMRMRIRLVLLLTAADNGRYHERNQRSREQLGIL